MNKKQVKKLSIILAAMAGLLVFLFATNPKNLSIGWLILPFIWLFICIFLVSLFVLDLFGVGSKKRLTIATLTGLVPSVALLLNSVNQLTLRDGLLVLIIGLIAIFYSSKLEIGK